MRATMIDALGGWIGRPLAALLIPGWFACSALAAIAAGFWLLRRARRAGDDTEALLGAWISAYLAAIIAGIAVPAVVDLAQGVATGRGLRLRWAGMVSYYGFSAAAIAVWLRLRHSERLTPLRFADLAAAPLGLALAIARTGCFLAGCDYGQVSSAPWALRFPAGSPAHAAHLHEGWVPAGAAASLPVHPTQLYEAALGIALCALALAVGRSRWGRAQEGRTILVAAVAYALGRALIEAFRGDAGRGFFGPLSSAQVVAALFVGALCLRVAFTRLRVAAVAAALVLAAAATPARADRQLEVGGYLAGAAPLNRRAEQVPALGGLSLGASLAAGELVRVGVDVDSLSNEVATHASFLAVAGIRRPLSPTLELGGRVGFGATFVNFDDPSFRDHLTWGSRVGASLDWRVAERWALSWRPLELDLIGSADLGGSILSAQMRIGVVYRHDAGGAPAPATVAAPATAAR